MNVSNDSNDPPLPDLIFWISVRVLAPAGLPACQCWELIACAPLVESGKKTEVSCGVFGVKRLGRVRMPPVTYCIRYSTCAHMHKSPQIKCDLSETD